MLFLDPIDNGSCLCFINKNELVLFLLIAVDTGLGNIKPPSVDAKFFLFQALLNEGVAGDVLHLL